jgi:hypothetical protein
MPHERICLVHQLDVYGDESSIEASRRMHMGICPYALNTKNLKPLVLPNEVYCGCQLVWR